MHASVVRLECLSECSHAPNLLRMLSAVFRHGHCPPLACVSGPSLLLFQMHGSTADLFLLPPSHLSQSPLPRFPSVAAAGRRLPSFPCTLGPRSST
jgi:hypothetical protein